MRHARLLQKPTLLSVTPFDLLVCSLIVIIGALQFAFAQQGAAFYGGDTTYLELARSLIDRHSYGFDYRAETTLPPGFPAILAGLILGLGDGHAGLVRAMVVFATAGLLVTYVLLRRTDGNWAAGAICLLTISSPVWFRFASSSVLSDMPYFFLSSAALLFAEMLDAAEKWGARLAWFVATAVFLAASIATRSSGITLVVALGMCIVSSFLVRRSRAARRTVMFGALAVIGIATQLAWTAWAKPREVSEWPIGGYPKSYLAQLAVKNGNEPDQGPLALADLPLLVEHNAVANAAALASLITRQGTFEERWFMPWIAVPIALIVIGLVASIFHSGGRLYDWYFLVYQAVFLLWPWDFEFRFMLPIAPLALLYLWRGVRIALVSIARRRRGPMAVAALISAICGAVAFVLGWASHDKQMVFAFFLWTLAGSLAAVGCVTNTRLLTTVLQSRWTRRAGVAAYAVLFAIGITQDVAVALSNSAFDVTQYDGYPQIRAALWLREHTPDNTVVMARQLDVVYHYAGRRVIWFPPTADADLLMNGIDKYHVDFVVVVARGQKTYWRPGEDEAFDRLLEQYPGKFLTVQEGVREKIYAIVHAPQNEAGD